MADVSLLNYLNESNIFLDKAFGDIDELLEFLVDSVEGSDLVKDTDLLFSDLKLRCSMGGIAFEDGVAVPHARTDAVVSVVMAFVRLGVPMDLGAPDGSETKFIFFIAIPKHLVDEYVQLLGHIMRIMKRDGVRKRLSECRTAQEVLSLFSEVEVKG